MSSPKQKLSPFKMFLILGGLFTVYAGVQLGTTYFKTKRDIDMIRHIVASEELILQLNSELRLLSKSARNLVLPDKQSRQIFADETTVIDLQPNSKSPSTTDAVAISDWQAAAEEKRVSRDDVDLWRSLFGEIELLEHAKFYFVSGKFDDVGDLNRFSTVVGFKGLAKHKAGGWIGVRAKQIVQWSNDQPESASSEWKITDWKLKSLRTYASERPMFAEALSHAIPSDSAYDRLRNSKHEAAVKEYYATGARRLPWPYFTPISANQRPGISVVDVDQDGFDDLYVMVRRGRNQLLRNRGDGTFEEVAGRWGLDLEDYSSCGIFADFDNDGDPDLMLGRSIKRSVYLENNGRRFVEKFVSTEPDTLPYLVVSMSAADYNGDGLLDIYFSTYRPAVLESIIAEEAEDQKTDWDGSEIVEDSRRWPTEFLTEKAAKEYERRLIAATGDEQNGRILDQIGPPNVLLVNRGNGKFDVAAESEQLAVWRNTLQASWADFDQDGDPDLYIANDWSQDNLFRNDDGQFTEITQEMGTNEFGFAMGVSWGDYDRDGLQDLYVSNMYSKAGRRIMAQIAELNPSFPQSVNGNYLYRSTEDGFKLVSGLEPPKLTVAEAGWSWGGQFADFDNDGWLDLYVLSGYFSAPPEFASNVDL